MARTHRRRGSCRPRRRLDPLGALRNGRIYRFPEQDRGLRFIVLNRGEQRQGPVWGLVVDSCAIDLSMLIPTDDAAIDPRVIKTA